MIQALASNTVLLLPKEAADDFSNDLRGRIVTSTSEQY